LRWSCNFCPLVYVCAELSLLVTVWWPIFASLELNQLDHHVWSIKSVVCKYFIEDYGVCIHQGNWPIIFYNSYILIQFWYQVILVS
jgi:hypothetical protein